jgi:hypothetical protein
MLGSPDLIHPYHFAALRSEMAVTDRPVMGHYQMGGQPFFDRGITQCTLPSPLCHRGTSEGTAMLLPHSYTLLVSSDLRLLIHPEPD